jgi:hypothetical protein
MVNEFEEEDKLIESIVACYSEEIVEVPEYVDTPTKWIDKDMDKQPNESIIDQYIGCLTNVVPDILPSYIDKIEWKRKQPEYVEFQAKMMIEEDELDTLMNKRYQDEIVVPYRKELREWYMKRKNSFPATNHIEVDGIMFNTDACDPTASIIDKAIKKSIRTNGTEDTSTEGSGSN